MQTKYNFMVEVVCQARYLERSEMARTRMDATAGLLRQILAALQPPASSLEPARCEALFQLPSNILQIRASSASCQSHSSPSASALRYRACLCCIYLMMPLCVMTKLCTTVQLSMGLRVAWLVEQSLVAKSDGLSKPA